MSYDNLSSELQYVLLANHSYMTKWLVFFVLIFLSAFYVFVLWKKHKKTKYVTTAIVRFFIFSLSIVYLFVSPLTLLLMTPEYSFLEFYTLPLMIYSIFVVILLILLFIDFIRYGAFVMLGLAGLDMDDENVKEIVRQMDNSKHFLKLGKKYGK